MNDCRTCEREDYDIMRRNADAGLRFRAPFGPDGCHCISCLMETGNDPQTGLPWTLEIMSLCPICGNKRCPKATNHRLDCTASNDPGQAGSAYSK